VKNYIFLFFIFLAPCFLFSQNTGDSLLRAINLWPDDTAKVNKLVNTGWALRSKNNPTSIKCLQLGLKIATTLKYKDGIARSKCYLGVAYNISNDIGNAIKFCNESIVLFEELKDSIWLVAAHRNLGNAWIKKGNYSKALASFLNGLRISESIGSKRHMSYNLSGIASVYYYQGNRQKALEFYGKNLKITEELNDSIIQCTTLNNMAGIYYELGKFDEGLKTAQRGLLLAQQLDRKKEIANSYIIMANIFSDMGDNKKAEPYYLKAIAMQKENGDLDGLLVTLFNIADIYVAQGQTMKALDYKTQALEISKELEEHFRVQQSYEGLAKLYYQAKDFKTAYEFHVLYANLKDSLFSIDNNKVMAEMNTKYETEKKDKELIKKDAEIVTQSAKAQEQATQRNYFIIGFIIVFLLSGLIYRSYRIKNKANAIIEAQKKEVEEQKELLEEKNKEVSDSIHYAKRIQRALLAGETVLNKNLKDYFVYYQPKDIVSGDFYWAANFDNKFYLIAADCTGHGVPGAFMSLLNISKLNETINEKKIGSPDKILNNIRKEIIHALNPEGSDIESKDGMDCILCAFDFENNKLEYAAANNSFYIVRNKELVLCAADKMPVGKSPQDETPFTLRTIDLQKGDVVYIFTDGLPDQFGGPKGKKYKYKQLEDLLIENIHQPMAQQAEILSKSFNSWKGDLEQVDDVLLIGIKV
jgi:serine phosphatase RsbU (regulator of sigma subunit)/tetratricopeptide (TPR) repeat protein